MFIINIFINFIIKIILIVTIFVKINKVVTFPIASIDNVTFHERFHDFENGSIINSTIANYSLTDEHLESNNSIALEPSVQSWRCHCWSSTVGLVFEVECRCEGPALVRIPQKLYVGMQRLTITSAGLPKLRKTGLKRYANFLEDIMLTDLSEFDTIESGVFENLIVLRTIYISNAPKLQHLQTDCFRGISNTLKTLKIINCGLLRVPDLSLLSHNTILHMVDLEGNRISNIEQHSIKIKTEELILDNNALIYIDNFAFSGSEIAKLSLKNNLNLKDLHKLAFAGITNILELDLSKTSLEELPTHGLQTLEILKIQNTHSLKTIPSVYNFKNLQFAWLTHPFHCCAFKFPSQHDPSMHKQRIEELQNLQKQCIDKGYNVPPLHSATSLDPFNNNNSNENKSFGESNIRMKRWFKDLKYNTTNQNDGDLHSLILQNEKNETNDFFYSSDEMSPITGAPIPISIDDTFNVEMTLHKTFFNDIGEFHDSTADVSPNDLLEAVCGNLTQKYTIDVACFPIPDALNPCEDVMGSNWLRVSVWIVVLLAVFGNAAVLIVLFSNLSDVTVPKFLMSNLALADFCMGLYLLLIASIDVHSIGEYFNVAYDWQYGSGCKAAGFLTVFAGHLSIFTLTIITLERWFAITYAMYLNKRLRLKSAGIIMVFGWIYSIVMALLPLIGVSNYSSTSICLPMETRDRLDISYLVTILALNGLAFFIILICYAQIYYSLGKETRQAAKHARHGEMTIAKKMALLVFTNFACWAPIAFFGLTALAGYPLIDVAKSKILLVFFYPLNSCANPYLYAILTAQYRRDLFILLSKYGLCIQRAQQYKMTYSAPATNMTNPMPLIERNSLSERRTSQPNRNNDETNEAFV